jgi:hypothetical protein
MIRKSPSEPEILQALSNRTSLEIISSIANGITMRSELSDRKDSSRKQYYSKMALLISRGLIRRESGKLFLTSLGRISYQYVMKIDYAIANYWKLKAIDSMQDSNEMSRNERHRIIKTIIGNDKSMQKILDSQISAIKV